MHSVAFRHCLSVTRSGPLIGRLSRLCRVLTPCRHGSKHAALLQRQWNEGNDETVSQTDKKRVVLVDGMNVMPGLRISPASLFAVLHVHQLRHPSCRAILVFDGPEPGTNCTRKNLRNDSIESVESFERGFEAFSGGMLDAQAADAPMVVFAGRFAKDAADELITELAHIHLQHILNSEASEPSRLHLWTADGGLKRAVYDRTGGRPKGCPPSLFKVMGGKFSKGPMGVKYSLLDKWPPHPSWCEAARHPVSAIGILELIQRRDGRCAGVLESLSKHDNWVALAKHEVSSEWLRECLSTDTLTVEQYGGVVSDLAGSWRNLCSHPTGSAVLAAAHSRMNSNQLKGICDTHSQDLHSLSYDAVGSSCVKSLVRNVLSGRLQSSGMLSEACFRGDWITPATDEIAHKVVCAFVPYECRAIIEASVVRFGSDWAAIMASHPHAVYVIHALLWEAKANIHTSALTEWAEEWKSSQTPQMLNVIDARSQDQLTSAIQDLADGSRRQFKIQDLAGADLADGFRHSDIRSEQAKLVRSIEKRMSFGR